MGTAQKFEELECWQCARELVGMVYTSSRVGPLSKDYGLKDQIRRASVSVMNNIAEGFTRFGRKEMVRFFNISQSSASEVQSMTYILADLNYLPKERCEEIRLKALECRNKIIAFMRYHKNQI
ncbi:MAG: four helix bundle protein [Gracilimonas sp.]|uniref:four helix bundle protein n=1 Tax=Gracilimonas TaxID=649462 RepID=UPI001B051C64|nr:four helix bundle protein [Gracilimonas sp.]MBO6585067.1 four helix bundle protein [Gracilimonas sp.]MBO6615662.1 four helix bundle protein [Gracilimonas sp.]